MYRLFIADHHVVIRHGIRPRVDGYGDRRRSQHDESTPPSSETAMQALNGKTSGGRVFSIFHTEIPPLA